jgi:hypothetical protein
MPRIMREWTEALTIRQQAVLIAAVRGCDGAPKDDPSKSVLWALRWEVLYPSEAGVDPHKTRSFMGYTRTLSEDVRRFLASLDQYPFHFVMHVMHAAEIIGYKHPELEKRLGWKLIYEQIVCDNLHCRPETEDMLDERLEDR